MTPSQPHPTQRSLARDLGLSVATVSLALRDSPTISLEVRHKVNKYAEKMGYRRDAVMGQLLARMRQRAKPTLQGLIACVSCCKTSPEWDRWACHKERIAGAEARAAELGYRMDRFWAYEPGVTAKRLNSIFLARRIEGIFFPIVDVGLDMPEDLQILVKNFPCATTLPYPQTIHHAMNNLFQSVQTAFEELVKLGYRRIGLATNLRADARSGMQAQDGYVSISYRNFGEPGLPVFDLDGCTAASFRMWLKAQRPDAVITHAKECLEWAEGADLRVPQNLGLVHLDKAEGPDWAALDQQHYAIGATAADMIIDQIHRRNWSKLHCSQTILIDSIFCPGKTVRHLAAVPSGLPLR